MLLLDTISYTPLNIIGCIEASGFDGNACKSIFVQIETKSQSLINIIAKVDLIVVKQLVTNACLHSKTTCPELTDS